MPNLILSIVAKFLGINLKESDTKLSLNPEQEAKLRNKFGDAFADKFIAAHKADDVSQNSSAGAENTDNDDLYNTLRDHFRTEANQGMQQLQEQVNRLNTILNDERQTSSSLQEMVTALSSETEPPVKPESPNGLKGKAGVPKVMSVDMSKPHYKDVAHYLQYGVAPAVPAAETIDVADLKQEFGTFLSQAQNNLDIIKQLFQGFTSAKYFTVVPAVTEYRAVQAFINSVVQQFTYKWTPAGKTKFTPLTVKNRRHKINVPIIPAEVLDSYMFKLYDEGLSPDQMPITKYIWNELVYPMILQDIELRMVFKGKFEELNTSDVNEGDPGQAPEQSMDGLETILVDEKAKANTAVNFYQKDTVFNPFTATPQQVLDFVEGFVDWISPMYRNSAMNVYCSPEFYKVYKRSYKKIWGVNSGQDGDFGRDKIDFSTNTLVPLDGMYGSPILFSTPKQNMVLLRHKNQVPRVINDVQKFNYEVRLFGEFWLGAGFPIAEAVFAYVPDGYNPYATISAKWGASTDFQKWNYEDESGSGAGSESGGI